MSYLQLWAILANWRTEFSTDDFGRVFPSPDPRKILHDMTSKNLLRRVGRGRYRVSGFEEFVRLSVDVEGSYDLLRRARLSYALTKVDGVFIWTKGGYNANRFFGSYPIYINVLKKDLKKWKSFISNNRKKFTLDGSRPTETLYGAYYVLFPGEEIESVLVGGFSAEPLDKTIEFCKKEKYTYEPALEMLDKGYNLGLNVKYEAAEATT